MANPSRMDDFGVPPFMETNIKVTVQHARVHVVLRITMSAKKRSG